MIKIVGVFILTALFSVIILWMSKDVSPSSKLYEFKRLYEIAVLTSKRTPAAKADYYIELLDQRLNEIETETTHPSNKVLPTTYRYSATAGNLTDLIIANNLRDEAKIAKRKISQHKKILAQIIEKNLYNSRGYVSTSLDYLTINERKLDDYL